MSYVFVYGSLMRKSRSDGLGFDNAVGVKMNGWRRVWNVASDPADKHRAYLLPDGSRYNGLIASLGLERYDVGSVLGVVGEVSESGLAELDRRELEYRRVDVSSAVDWGDISPKRPFLVLTYVPKQSAVQRYNRARMDGAVACVKEYYDWVQEAAALFGADYLRDFVSSPGLDGLPILDLVRVDDG